MTTDIYSWTGNGGDNKWSTVSNWNSQSLGENNVNYPGINPTDQVKFNNNTALSLILDVSISISAIFSEGIGSIEILDPSEKNTITISENNLIIFNHSEFIIRPNITGIGRIIKNTDFGMNNTGLIVLVNLTDYTGIIEIRVGLLQLGSLFLNGTLNNNIVDINNIIYNDTAVIFNHDNNVLFSGMIFGSGTVDKHGIGTLIFKTQTYSGITTIYDGVIQLGSNFGGTKINGSLTSNIRIEGGSLTGSGNIDGNINVGIDGNLNIGLSPGVINCTSLDLYGSVTITIYGSIYGGPHSQNAINSLIVSDALYIDSNAQFNLIVDISTNITEIENIKSYTWKYAMANNIISTNDLIINYPNGFNKSRWKFINNGTELNLSYSSKPYCLTENTMVLTPSGYIKIDKLKIGDYVLTENNRKSKIISIYNDQFKSSFLTNPYIVPKNSLDNNYPPKEIRLSGNHLIKHNNKWIMPRNCNFKQDTSKKIINYYNIKLENYETDNLIINGGAIVASYRDKEYIEVYKKRINIIHNQPIKKLYKL